MSVNQPLRPKRDKESSGEPHSLLMSVFPHPVHHASRWFPLLQGPASRETWIEDWGPVWFPPSQIPGVPSDPPLSPLSLCVSPSLTSHLCLHQPPFLIPCLPPISVFVSLCLSLSHCVSRVSVSLSLPLIPPFSFSLCFSL